MAQQAGQPDRVELLILNLEVQNVERRKLMGPEANGARLAIFEKLMGLGLQYLNLEASGSTRR